MYLDYKVDGVEFDDRTKVVKNHLQAKYLSHKKYQAKIICSIWTWELCIDCTQEYWVQCIKAFFIESKRSPNPKIRRTKEKKRRDK